MDWNHGQNLGLETWAFQRVGPPQSMGTLTDLMSDEEEPPHRLEMAPTK